MNDPYEILEVSPAASQEEIRQAFRKLAKKYHPDRNSSADTAIKFQAVYEAYEVLSDAAARARYDAKKYESQRFRTRTKSREDLLRSRPYGYNTIFATAPNIIDNLQKTLEALKRETIEAKRDLDEEFQDYETRAQARTQSLREEMRNMVSGMANY